MLASYFPNAQTTNAFTAGLEVFLGIIYSCLGLYQYRRGNPNFTWFSIAFFFSNTLLSMMGVYVHYVEDANFYMWMAICFVSFIFFIFSFQLVHTPIKISVIASIISFASLGYAISIVYSEAFGFFNYIAAPGVLTYTICACYSRGFVRLGFIGIILSSLTWMSLRTMAIFCPAHILKDHCTYDNDIYHLMIIVSIFLVFLGVLKGQLTTLYKK